MADPVLCRECGQPLRRFRGPLREWLWRHLTTVERPHAPVPPV